MAEASYDASDITVLEGLDPVRKRPGMYIGSTGPSGLHHLVWEVVDNAVDEAMAGYCTQIDVTLLADGGVQVVDNGRGIPDRTQPAISGQVGGGAGTDHIARRREIRRIGAYKVSGGLHGVGVSVVNALSTRLVLEIDSDGRHHAMEFLNGGEPTGKLRDTGPAPQNRTGTSVTFWPDASIFEEIDFRAQTVVERLQIMAFLNKGLEINFTDKRPGRQAAPNVQVQRRHHRLRPAPECLQGGALPQGRLVRADRGDHGGRDRPPVERRLLREHPLLRQWHLDHRGRDA